MPVATPSSKDPTALERQGAGLKRSGFNILKYVLILLGHVTHVDLIIYERRLEQVT